MYTISEIATLTGAHRLGDKDYQIDWLLTDSRSLCFPQSTLFFASSIMMAPSVIASFISADAANAQWLQVFNLFNT